MLSRKTHYALRAMLALAKHPPNTLVTITALSVEAAVPGRFLENILIALKRAGFVQSRRGKKGGYLLAKAPDEISFGAIISAIEGTVALSACASTSHYQRCEDCADEPHCLIRKALLAVEAASIGILDTYTISASHWNI